MWFSNVDRGWLSLLAYGLAINTVTSTSNLATTPPVKLNLKAGWSSGPLLYEVLETAYKFNATSYFPLIDTLIVNQKSNSFRKLTQHKLYDLIMDIIFDQEKFIKSESKELFELFMSTRYMTPKLEAYNQFYKHTVRAEIGGVGEFDENCANWIQFNKMQFCGLEKFKEYLKKFEFETYKPSSLTSTEILSFDHVYPSTYSTSTPTAFLYANILESTFQSTHQYLAQLADQGQIVYVLRYQPQSSGGDDDIYLSGYGAHLDIKNMEYKVLDDRVLTSSGFDEDSKDSNPLDPDNEYAKFNSTLVNKLVNEPTQIMALNDDNFTNMGYKVSKSILKSDQPLALWSYLTQNFPKHASYFSNKKHSSNKGCSGIMLQKDWFRSAPAPDVLFVNGVAISLEEMDLFRLLEVINIERDIVQSFSQIGIESEQAIQFLKDGFGESKQTSTPFSNSFDIRDTDEGGNLVIWLNDLEKDVRYKDWTSELSQIAGSMYGGYLPEVKVNYASVLFCLDLSVPESIETLVTDVFPLIEGQVPIRFGFIPLISKNQSAKHSKVIAGFFHYLNLNQPEKIISTLRTLYTNLSENTDTTPQSWIQSQLKNLTPFSTSDQLLEDETLNKAIEGMEKYMDRLNLDTKTPQFFINGKRLKFDSNYQRTLVGQLNSQIQFISTKVASGEITSNENIYDYLLSQPTVYRSYNKLIFDTKSDDVVTYSGSFKEHSGIRYIVPDLDIEGEDKKEKLLVSIMVVADLDSQVGSELVKRAIDYMKRSQSARFTFFHTSTITNKMHMYRLSDSIYRQLHLLSDSENLKVSKFEIDEEGTGEIDWSSLHSQLRSIGIDGTKPKVIVNGKVYPLTSDKDYKDLQLDTLVAYELTNRLIPIQTALIKSELFQNITSDAEKDDLYMKISGMVLKNKAGHTKMARFESDPGSRKQMTKFSSEECRITEGNKDKAFVHVSFILNPLGKEGMRWAPILQMLSGLNGIYLDGYMNPSNDIELPKRLSKTFYRYSVSTKMEFDNSTGALIQPQLKFERLPSKTLLTLGLDTITSWVVAPTKCHHDLDNIQLLETPIQAQFTLKHLLIEGHAKDTLTQTAPRGLQFIVTTPKGTTNTDTLVMANLGYFQLKANPGVFEIELRDGRSKEGYTIDSIGSKDGSERNRLVLQSFGGAILFPRVSKKPGMEGFDLLTSDGDKDKETKGGWTSLTEKWFGAKDNNFMNVANNQTINIFTVASGHLYERFLSVMMLSVLKHTNNPVKFWFIENFLSPSFKQFIPHMAKKYNFQYELVTYQWPHWLNAQTDKQRSIWGYKILFLDVLFPLSVDKIIFVDADQVVRADLKELIEEDLKGAPYGYVPFCDTREGMAGFRFWEQGYWKDHLAGKPYHISALYVVDLNRFRNLAAGDHLRGHYQMLSYDPNSLANLDQDLPNHLQAKLPIHSLPQEWLWCETWCDDQSLKKAKTIDLCNNPLTKEPKLERAKRILGEWDGYDQEAEALRKTINGDLTEELKDPKTDTKVNDQFEGQDDKDEL